MVQVAQQARAPAQTEEKASNPQLKSQFDQQIDPEKMRAMQAWNKKDPAGEFVIPKDGRNGIDDVKATLRQVFNIPQDYAIELYADKKGSAVQSLAVTENTREFHDARDRILAVSISVGDKKLPLIYNMETGAMYFEGDIRSTEKVPALLAARWQRAPITENGSQYT
jgi:hypothetical protein